MRKLKPGERFGRWTVISRSVKTCGKQKVPSARCICDCGIQSNVSSYNLIKGSSTQCPECARASLNKIVKGYCFGEKTVISRDGNIVAFKCECGRKLKCRANSFHRSEGCRYCALKKYSRPKRCIIAVGEREFTARECAEVLECTVQRIYQLERGKLEERMVEALCHDQES